MILVNKIDLLRDDSTLSADKRAALGTEDEVLERWRAFFPGASVLPLSARKQIGTDAVLERVLALLPLHPPFFPKDQLTDKPERFFASEILRESIFELYSQECLANPNPNPNPSPHLGEAPRALGDAELSCAGLLRRTHLTLFYSTRRRCLTRARW